MKTIEYMKIGLRRRLSATRMGSASLDTNKATLVQRGFTIVELLIVIVVIAILAAISIVAYMGVQERARDAMRMEHGRQISQALQLYALENPKDKSLPVLHGSGCGHNGNGNGWFNTHHDRNTGNFDEVLAPYQCLEDMGLLQADTREPLVDIEDRWQNDRTGGHGHPSYYIQSCWSSYPGRTYIMLKLENPNEPRTADDVSCSNARTQWNNVDRDFNYFVRVDI